MPILPGHLHRQTSHHQPPIAKYSAEWKGHGHVVLKAVTGDAVHRDLDVCHLTKFLKFFCLPIADLLASFLWRSTSEGQRVAIASHSLQGVCIVTTPSIGSFYSCAFSVPLPPSISGSSAVHIATSPPRSSSQPHERDRPRALSTAVCFGVRRAAIVHRPQCTILVELLCPSSMVVHTTEPLPRRNTLLSV